MSVRRTKGFTVIELVVVILAAVWVLIFLPMLFGRRHGRSAPLMRESVNARNIGMAMNVYANSNKDYFPGLTADGDYISKPFNGKYYSAKPNATSTDEEDSGEGCTISTGNNLAMAISLEDGGSVPAQWISYGETGEVSTGSKKIEVIAPGTAVAPAEVRDEHSSFAMLAYGRESLKEEWKSNQNQQTVTLATRVIFHAKAGAFNTVWTDSESGKFQGAVVRGDNSTSLDAFQASDIATNFGTLKYGAVTFTPSNKPTATTVGIFGRSTDMKNFDAAATAGQLGSAND